MVREFYYFRAGRDEIKNEEKAIDFTFEMRVIDINDYDSIPSFWDFRPSWQNSIESINRSPEGFVCFGVFTEGELIGYGVFEPASGDVTQIAVDKRFRRKGVGSLLLRKMMEVGKTDSINIINTDITCESMTAFLGSKNIEPTGRQFEMIKKL